MTRVCNEQMSATSPFIGKNPMKQTREKRLSNSEKLNMLEAAFERLYANKPINVPKWTAIDKSAVEAEAQLPAHTLQDRIQYQERLISKIYFAQELAILKNYNFPTLSLRKKAKKHQELVSKLYHALNRLIDDKPLNVKKGTRISPYSVSLEAGGSGSYFGGNEPYLSEILKDIEVAKQEQQNQKKNPKKAAITPPNSLRSQEDKLRIALKRLIEERGIVFKSGTQITLKTVCIEAGFQPDLIRQNQDYFKKFITEIEQAEVQRINVLFEHALDRLLKNNPRYVPNNSRITLEMVSIEAGLVRSYLNCYKGLFSEIIDKIKKIPKENVQNC